MDKLRNSIRTALKQRQLNELVTQAIQEENFCRAKELQQSVADKLESIQHHTYALKVRNCFAHGHLEIWNADGNLRTRWMPRIWYTQHPMGYDVAVGACGLPKLCPFHARMETRRRIERYLPTIEKSARSGRLRFVTLTTRNAPMGGLATAWDEIWNAWTKLRKSDCWTASGALAAFEVTYSDYDGGSWNAHLHVLCVVPRGVDFSYRRIQAKWEEITGAPIVDFEQVRSSSPDDLVSGLHEVLKYVSKFDDLAAMPDEAFSEWFEFMHGRRALRSYGEWYRLQDLDLDEEELVGELVAAFDWCWSEAGGLRVFLIQVNKSLTAEEHSQEFGSYELRNLALARAGPG